MTTTTPTGQTRQTVPGVDSLDALLDQACRTLAIVDRMTFNANIVETGSQSYRVHSTQARLRDNAGVR